MITIEASNIYFGGGFVLLEQILDYCEKNSLSANVYLGYQEVFNTLSEKKYRNILLKKTNPAKTVLRYLTKRKKTLFFCNLPPFVKNQDSVLFVHNILWVRKPEYNRNDTLIFNLKKFLYYQWIGRFSKNVTVIGCQTDAVKSALFDTFNLNANLFPFYPEIKPQNHSAKTFDFCYISSAAPHKNHRNLFLAMDQLALKKDFTLAVTIQSKPDTNSLIREIGDINKKHSRQVISNLGFVSREEVQSIYNASRCLVFPSREETIALPLIEAIQSGLKVISSDRPFSHNVIENPIVFNPDDPNDIEQVASKYLSGEFDEVEQGIKVPNKLKELISLLSGS